MHHGSLLWRKANLLQLTSLLWEPQIHFEACRAARGLQRWTLLWRPSHKFHVQQDTACKYPGGQEIACLHAHWRLKHHRGLLGMLMRLRQSRASDGDDRAFFARRGHVISSNGTLLTTQCSLQGSLACILQKSGLRLLASL